MRRILAAGTAIAMAVPIAAKADELSDLKGQLETAMKSIQALQERVRSLEAQKARTVAAVPPNAQASAPMPPNAQAAVFLPVKAAPAAPPSQGAPVVAPNEKPVRPSGRGASARREPGCDTRHLRRALRVRMEDDTACFWWAETHFLGKTSF
jgi:hypothetical protein